MSLTNETTPELFNATGITDRPGWTAVPEQTKKVKKLSLKPRPWGWGMLGIRTYEDKDEDGANGAEEEETSTSVQLGC